MFRDLLECSSLELIFFFFFLVSFITRKLFILISYS